LILRVRLGEREQRAGIGCILKNMFRPSSPLYTEHITNIPYADLIDTINNSSIVVGNLVASQPRRNVQINLMPDRKDLIYGALHPKAVEPFQKRAKIRTIVKPFMEWLKK
jgi:hypothetical protein